LNCQDARYLIHGYMDGELDLVKSLEVEQHLQDCPACTQVYKNHQALRSAMSASSLYFTAPAPLRKRIQSSVRQTSQAARAPWVMPWRWIGAAASLAVVLTVIWGVTRSLLAPSAGDVLAQQVVASHVRSLMADHLTDVASSDQHTVKPWFDGKLDFSPAVPDPTNQGFPLIGGRLDYLDNRPVAALVYRRQQHIINLFIWPSPGAPDVNTKTDMRQGYYVVHWTKSGMTYWAISDLNDVEFRDFVQLVQTLAAQATSP